MTWVGHFHPLLLHLPIGLLTGWLALEFWPKRKSDDENAADFRPIRLLAALTALSAVAAALTGYLLAAAKPETFSGETVDDHRIAGIAFGVSCVVTGLICFLTSRQSKWQLALYRGLLIISALLLVPAGHLGGSLTHGEDYLTKEAPDFVKRLLGSDIESVAGQSFDSPEAPFFAAIVEPVLSERCYACHAGSKKEGGVSLKPHSELAQYLGEDGKLLPTLNYPIDHELHMPPRGKPQLLPDEKALLQWYAASPAPVQATVAEVTLPEDLAHLDDHLEKSTESLPPIDGEAVRQLREAQVFVHPVAADSRLLWIDAAAAAPRFEVSLLQPLKRLAPNIQWLNLARTGLDDRALELAAACPNLTQLDLSYCPISDAGFSLLQDHPKLEKLTLVATPLSADSLPVIESLPELKTISVWQSQIPEDQLQGPGGISTPDRPAKP